MGDEIDNRIIFESKYPITAYLGSLFYLGTVGYCFYQIICGELSVMSGIPICSIIIFTVDFIVCGYSCKIILKKESFQIIYFFPWRTNHSIYFNRITDIKTYSSNNYRLFSSMYLKFDSDNNQYFKVISNFGILKNIFDFELIVKDRFNLEK